MPHAHGDRPSIQRDLHGEERAQEIGTLRAENASLRDEVMELREAKGRAEGEVAAYQMTAQQLPKLLEQMQRLTEQNGKLIADNTILAEARNRLEATTNELEARVMLLEAPKAELERRGILGWLGR